MTIAKRATTYAIVAVVSIASTLLIATSANFVAQRNTGAIDQNNVNQAFGQTIVGIRQNVITVTGEAMKNVPPNQVVINFGLETRARAADQASSMNADTMNKVIDAVKALGITDKDLSTSRYNIDPNYDGVGRIIRGFTVSNTVSVKTSMLDKASQIIDAAVKAGANRVDGVFFGLSDATAKAQQEQLIRDAVSDAKTKADKALEPLSEKIIGVKSVSVEQGYDFYFRPVYATPVPASSEPAPTPVFKSEEQVSMTVTVIFLIE